MAASARSEQRDRLAADLDVLGIDASDPELKIIAAIRAMRAPLEERLHSAVRSEVDLEEYPDYGSAPR